MTPDTATPAKSPDPVKLNRAGNRRGHSLPPGKGGARAGAGRPRGPNKFSRQNLRKAKAGGILPLDLLLAEMRTNYETAEKLRKVRGKKRDESKIKEYAAIACERAREAAPFLHPRLTSVEANINTRITHEQALDELEREDQEGTK